MMQESAQNQGAGETGCVPGPRSSLPTGEEQVVVLEHFLPWGWLSLWPAPSSIQIDAPYVAVSATEEWSPRNSDTRFMASIPLACALQHSRSVIPDRSGPPWGLRLSVAARDNQWPKWEKAWGLLGFAEGGAGQFELWLYARGWRPIVRLHFQHHF